jgi:hypothetical protein
MSKAMAICADCGRNMADPKTISCVHPKPLTYPDGTVLLALPYGPSALQPDVEVAPERCRDCAVMYGGTHHQLCCLATCPRCAGQLLSCACLPGD